MKYLDSGSRKSEQTLGQWLERALAQSEIAEIRWQAGFYTSDGLGFLAPTLERARERDLTVVGLIGSNNGDTLKADVEQLCRLVGVPRGGARLGVVSFAGSFFHPKTYHITRADGSQAAYVGSANLTFPGVSGLHVEAGLALDTRAGDSGDVLRAIRDGIDAWFLGDGRPGVNVIQSLEDVIRLSEVGILAEHPPPRARNESGAANQRHGAARPRNEPLVIVPSWHVPGNDNAATLTSASRGDAEDGLDDDVPTDSSLVEWELVWRSNDLSERDLNIPTGTNTNATGSMGLKRGAWEGIDHRHYFREQVFKDLQWSRDARKPTREVATAVFEVWIGEQIAGETALTISHNTDVASRTYEQRNEMTHLRWGEAKSWVASRELLGARLSLHREKNPQGVPKYRIWIEHT